MEELEEIGGGAGGDWWRSWRRLVEELEEVGGGAGGDWWRSWRRLVEELEEMERVEVLEWWKLMGWDEEGTVDMMRRKKVVGPDGVHLSVNANRFAAVSLCYRLAEKEVTISGGATKKMRIG